MQAIDSGCVAGDRPRMRASWYIRRSIIVALAGVSMCAMGTLSRANSAVREVLSVVPDARLVTVRLDIALGHGDETRRSAGQSAATAAWLRQGPSELMGPGEFERAIRRRGLEVGTDLGWRTTSIVLTGPAELAALAGSMVADRLTPGDLADAGVEAVRASVWLDAEASLRGVVGPMGGTSDTAVSAVEGGRTAFSSRLAASRLGADAFRRLALAAINHRPARVVISGPSAAVEAASEAFRASHPVTSAVHEPGRVAALSKPRRMVHRDALEVKQASDNHTHLSVAWTLRGLAADSGLNVAARDATLLALRAWLEHPGGSFYRAAVERHGAIHDLAITLAEHDAPVLVMTGKVAASTAADARRQLLQSLSDTLAHHLDELDLGGRLAQVDLAARFSDAIGRSQLLSELLSTGRAHDLASALAWLAAVDAELDGASLGTRHAFVRAALSPERRLIVTANPAELPRTARLVLGAATMRDYLRVLVDLQCPGPNFPTSVAELLRGKYALTARQYADLTRAVARDRRLMRDLAEDAEFRCQELRRLRGLMSAEKVVEMHEAIVCGPGHAPDNAPARKALARIFTRYKLDPAWYRPLLGMARELPSALKMIAEIDDRCGPPKGAL
jgi:hypothetical protein